MLQERGIRSESAPIIGAKPSSFRLNPMILNHLGLSLIFLVNLPFLSRKFLIIPFIS